MEVKVFKQRNGVVIVKSPYHPEFPPKAKALGGRWDPEKRVWHFAEGKEAQVRELVRGIYGDPDEERVTVRYELWGPEENELWLFGRLIARRPGRDAPVVLGEGVSILEGEFPPSAGSHKYPQLLETGDRVVLEIANVPVSLVPWL